MKPGREMVHKDSEFLTTADRKIETDCEMGREDSEFLTMADGTERESGQEAEQKLNVAPSSTKLLLLKEEEKFLAETKRRKLPLVNAFKGKSAPSLKREDSKKMMLSQSFELGEEVDVRFDQREEGLGGSWHRARICGCNRGLWQVEFFDLEQDEEGSKLREWVQLETDLPRGRHPKGTRLCLDDRPLIRPRSPPEEPRFRKRGGWPRDLWVEVYDSDAWWEGVLLEDSSPEMLDHGHGLVDVMFPFLKSCVEEHELRSVRVCKDWNWLTGEWTIRGQYRPKKLKGS